MLEVAKAIQYMHSLGIVFCSDILSSVCTHFVFVAQNNNLFFHQDEIFIDRDFHAMILPAGPYLHYIRKTPPRHSKRYYQSIGYSFEHNIYQFGLLLYEVR